MRHVPSGCGTVGVTQTLRAFSSGSRRNTMLKDIFFQGWEPLLRTAIGTTATYLALVALLRVAGQRTLAKWYAFDLIVTMALGSAFASGILSKDVTIAQSAAGFVTLVLLQFVVARTVVAVNRFRKVVNSSPALVFYNGEF